MGKNFGIWKVTYVAGDVRFVMGMSLRSVLNYVLTRDLRDTSTATPIPYGDIGKIELFCEDVAELQDVTFDVDCRVERVPNHE